MGVTWTRDKWYEYFFPLSLSHPLFTRIRSHPKAEGEREEEEELTVCFNCWLNLGLSTGAAVAGFFSSGAAAAN